MPLSRAKRLFAVIEDDVAVLNSLQYVLEIQGQEVCAFESAQAAIDSDRIMQADCLIIDYVLPDMDGLTMLGILRRGGLACPAVVIASNPTSRCRAAAEAAGAPLVEKPIMGRDLDDVLTRLLASSTRVN